VIKKPYLDTSEENRMCLNFYLRENLIYNDMLRDNELSSYVGFRTKKEKYDLVYIDLVLLVECSESFNSNNCGKNRKSAS